MTVLQEETLVSTRASIVASEGMTFVVTEANPGELDTVANTIESCDFVDSDLSGWKDFGHVHGSMQYFVVFKHGAHAGQYKTRVIELIKQAVPGITLNLT